MPQLTFEQSIAELRLRSLVGDDERPKLPTRMPSPDDDGLPVGLSFFRTLVEGDYSGLCLPRIFFCRSEVRDCSFRDTDISESFMCWNDFVDVDFSSASLRRCDLRSSIYTRVRFYGADLSGADLRFTSFEGCDFARANLAGAKVCRRHVTGLELSPEQEEQVDWMLFAGKEPPGG